MIPLAGAGTRETTGLPLHIYTHQMPPSISLWSRQTCTLAAACVSSSLKLWPSCCPAPIPPQSHVRSACTLFCLAHPGYTPPWLHACLNATQATRHPASRTATCHPATRHPATRHPATCHPATRHPGYTPPRLHATWLHATWPTPALRHQTPAVNNQLLHSHTTFTSTLTPYASPTFYPSHFPKF